MSTPTVRERQNNVSILLQATMTVLIAALVALNGWALHEINTLGKQVTSNTTKIHEFTSVGPRYTAIDAQRDQGVLAAVLKEQGLEIKELDGRLRIVEIKVGK